MADEEMDREDEAAEEAADTAEKDAAESGSGGSKKTLLIVAAAAALGMALAVATVLMVGPKGGAATPAAEHSTEITSRSCLAIPRT